MVIKWFSAGTDGFHGVAGFPEAAGFWIA